MCISIYIPWPFPPVWRVADNTKETTKTIGVSLRSSSNDEGSSRVWMALLEQHNPSSPVFHNLRRFIDAVSPTAPTTGLPLQGNPVATADANQNCITIIRHSFLFLYIYIYTYAHCKAREEIFLGEGKGEPLRRVRTSGRRRLSLASWNSELRPPADVTTRPPCYVRVASPASVAGGHKYWPSQPRRQFFRDHRPVNISLSLSSPSTSSSSNIHSQS